MMFGRKKSAAGEASEENRNILVADDDERILNIYRGLFTKGKNGAEGGLSIDKILNLSEESKPWNMTLVDQGLDAVHVVQESLERGERFACALLDVRMPPGIDGIEAAKRIRELDPNIFLAIVTAYTDRLPEEVERILGGNFTMVRKPFYGDELMQLVENYIQVWNNQHNYINRFV